MSLKYIAIDVSNDKIPLNIFTIKYHLYSLCSTIPFIKLLLFFAFITIN